MSKLNKDILYLIFEELEDDDNSLLSYLLVNKTWCEIIVPILWRDPWKRLKHGKERFLLDVIISHLSKESRNNLSKYFDFLINSYQNSLFNYISFCKHLNLNELQRIIDENIQDKQKISIIKSEIIDLFINGDAKFKTLHIPQQLDCQIRFIPGTISCFSEIEFLSCHTDINDNILFGLLETCNSLKELELIIEGSNNNYEIVRLIESAKNLFKVNFINKCLHVNELFCKNLENSLLKHANIIENFKISTKPLVTKILSSFSNLKRLELDNLYENLPWNCLRHSSLPCLQYLYAKGVPICALTSLIESTSGQLIEIKIDHIPHEEIDNKRIIQAIYTNCPNLRYLKLMLRNKNIIELKNLLVNCQHLSGLFIISNMVDTFDWDNLFEILTETSPTSLFKFKFSFCYKPIKLEFLKFFFDNWRDRHSLILQFSRLDNIKDLIEKYKTDGIIKKYNEVCGGDFEWV
ncbi:hypothetical protein RclHR1_03270008 [Rhizophagus clarus]|uniref:F-box domain-containing protein n=1 Tax=Rhizophagus clarus TaxID=94130 RepID=A0A2Z6R8M9_9GLOM|nr:hypothetical protein RclHR1_03270008 [Rhizophagus clarus]GES74732.1 hypothetical protein GLOIN_2v1786648 [Rhizophagus clarus]